MKKLLLLSALCLSVWTMSAQNIATFEEFSLAPESVWAGDENGEEWYDGMGYQQRFKSGGYSFKNICMPDWNSWMGFAYTNKTSTTYASISDQFNSCVGSGNNGSANYCVAFPDGTMWGEDFTIKIDGEPQVVPGFYITNSAWVVRSILEGDDMTPGAFGVGDYFKIIIHALDAEGKEIASRDFFLADYRSADETLHYYVKDWEFVDLSTLGKVAEFVFTFDGTKKNSFGLTTPTYFCMDDFGATGTERTHETANAITIKSSIVNAQPSVFNLNGIRVNKQCKGIVIKNGKKYLKVNN